MDVCSSERSGAGDEDLDMRPISRRALLISSAAATVAGCGAGSPPQRSERADEAEATAPRNERVPFHGAHQAGIVTPPQRHAHLLALDVHREGPGDLRDLLRALSQTAAALTTGTGAPAGQGTGEADGLDAARLTVTLGLGPSVFADDRFGLRRRAPETLRDLPAFRGDDLDPARCDGDLGVQVCCDDPQVAFAAVHALTLAAHGVATPRWTQAGFTSAPPGRTGRNLLGFRDGSRNLDPRTAADQLWLGAGAPPGMAGGTLMVVRRIRTLLDVWDATTLEQQERAIGRRKASGAPLQGGGERDAPDLARSTGGALVTPVNAHARLAAPESTGGARILRRGYNYTDGVDAATGQLDAGLVFVSFQRRLDQFVRIQQRLDTGGDALAKHLVTTGSAVFACPPGARRGGFVGEGLFA